MITRAALLALTLTAGPVRAALPPPADDVSKAYYAAIADLCAGKDRQGIADRLKPVVEKHPDSAYARLARPFLADVAASAKNLLPKPGAPPEDRLADTRVPVYLLKYAENWGEPLRQFVTKEPNDPVAELVAADRAAIARLIPRLADHSPTRCNELFSDRWTTPQPRVCDLALALIEYHGKCRFFHDTHFGAYLHQLPDAEREKVVARVTAWWAEVKDKSVAAGVRAQLPHAKSYPETVWMAKTLARLGEGEKTDDREFALNVLRDMVKRAPLLHTSAYAANALAELGDTSPVDIFYNEWKSWLGKPGLIHESGIAFYLCKHGKRREWELLHAISLEEVRGEQVPGRTTVWMSVLNSGASRTNPYAIPVFGLALGQTEITGSRYVDNRSQPFSYADTACESLQAQVGKDFGYKRDGTDAERLAAIRKAQAWWDGEGKTKHTFDFIETNMPPGKAPLPRPEK